MRVGITSAPRKRSAAPAPTPTARPGHTRAEIRSLAVRARLQVELDDIRARLGIPGVSVTVIFPDDSSWTGTSGRADVAANEVVTPDTAFALASVSKTYTAALILGRTGAQLPPGSGAGQADHHPPAAQPH